MALPLRVDDLPSFAGSESYEEEPAPISDDKDPHRKRQWQALLARVRLTIRAAEESRADKELLTTDMDSLLLRLFIQELKSLEEYSRIARNLRELELPPDQKAEFWKDGAETLGALRDARKDLVRMRAGNSVFTVPPVIEYPDEGGVSIDPKHMSIGMPYVFEFGDCSHVAVRLEDGSVDFYALPEPFEGDPSA